MYVDELIEELRAWKAPNAEVKVRGLDVTRVTAGDSNTLVLIPPEYQVDEEIEDLEDKVSELEANLEEMEEYEERIDTLESILNDVTFLLEDYLETLDEDCSEVQRALDLIRNEM